ncbi:MAG: hypothetical protein A2297_03070 [Elusimicrobia bacterium RIFOXYB2_FULL_48_7]|nr:MAG: hypothetical protein A2297_03070 [Elusimicrobia bacterium RIFOXYB2_FULL_48_7]
MKKDFESLKKMLYANFTFMDRVETTGILNKVIAQDVGITGMAARASGINRDLRKDFGACYNKIEFNLPEQTKGDVLARLNVRISEIEQSILIIQQCVLLLNSADSSFNYELLLGNKFGLGYVEGWRGPVLYWLKINEAGLIDRCKIVDASFHNWQGLSYCAPGNIVPDFPVCNKSFDLSYSGNDL